MQNFNNMLSQELLNDSKQELCLISKEELNQSKITLECGHTFNYLPIYQEFKEQKNNKKNSLKNKLRVDQLKCPYCRNIQNGLIPFMNIMGIVPLYGVNYPTAYVNLNNRCIHIYKKGPNKGKPCNNPCINSLCKKHSKPCKIEINKIDINLLQSYTLNQLKHIARTNKFRGFSRLNKKDLVSFVMENLSKTI